MMACLKYRCLLSRCPRELSSMAIRAASIPTAGVVTCKMFRTCRSYSTDEKETFYGSLTRNLRLMKQEIITKFKSPNLETMFDRSRVLWRHRGPDSLQEFLVITDSIIGGSSTAQLAISRNNKLLFKGNLSTDVPKDGESVRSGFCSLRTHFKYGSFNRKEEFDLTPFNLLHLRLRGDGRAYMINIYTNSYFSVNHDDVWSYFLFTRGGPYWQNVTIPFSKFFLSSHGRVQDKQAPVDLDRITAVGLTLADAVNGDFSLELDSITATYDASESEEFVYEEYHQQ